MPKYKSRLRKQEEVKTLKQALIFFGLTIGLILFFIFVGLPFLIRFSVFLGNLRTKTPLVEEKKADTVAPVAPRLKPLPEAINEEQIKISGFSEAKSQVAILLNGQKIQEIETDENGEFSSHPLSLRKGENEIKTYAQDEAGNKSSLSGTIFIIFDDEEPILEITQPQEGEMFYGAKNKIEIKGKTEEGARIFINETLTIVDLAGEFSKIIALGEGENTIKIKAEDKAGNTSEKEIKVSYYP